MILGIGTDILDLQRFRDKFSKYPGFCKKIFTPEENKKAQEFQCNRQSAFYAKRFAAKEAIFKALGIGPGKFLSWKDFSILSHESGKPYVALSHRGDIFCKKKFHVPHFVFHISLSDEKTYVQAFCILEGFIK